MKYIIAVEDQNEWHSTISKRFGRANGFYLVEDKSIIEYIDNANIKDAGHGAGIQTSQMCIDKGAEAVITGGDIGPKALEVLKAAELNLHDNVGEQPMELVYNEIFSN